MGLARRTTTPKLYYRGTRHSHSGDTVRLCDNVNHVDPEHHPEAEWRNLAKMKQPLKAVTPLKNQTTATKTQQCRR